MRSIVDSGVSGVPFCVAGDETLTAYTYKQLNTILEVSYEAKPTVAASVESVPDPTNNGVMVQTSPTGGAVGSNTPIFAVSSSDPSGNGLNYNYFVSPNADGSNPIWQSGLTSSTSVQVPTATLQPGTSYYWYTTAVDGNNYQVQTPVYSWSTSPTPTIANGSPAQTPADGSIIATTQPTLSAPTATSTNGHALTYAFRLTTGSDAQSGQIAQSPPLTPSGGLVTWPVPSGILQDGGSYTWVEIVNDGYDNWSPLVSRLSINTRVTTSGPSPATTVGPVSVNLANGNVSDKTNLANRYNRRRANGSDFELQLPTCL